MTNDVLVYRIECPEGVYIGQTNSLAGRWSAHKRQALVEGRNGPLYDSLRARPEADFSLEVLAEGLSRAEAKALEVAFIAEARSTYARVLNQSRGGDFDMADGCRIFWERVTADPSAYGGYFAKLSAAAVRRYPRVAKLLTDGAARWREENPREAYKMSRRGLRFANKANREAPRTPRPRAAESAETKAARAEAAAQTRAARTKAAQRRLGIEAARRVRKVWAGRNEEQRAAIGEKISARARARYEDEAEVARVSAQLVDARKNIDRDKQAKAASKGLKNYWAELRRDKKKFAEAMAQRAASRKANKEKRVE